jgi:hypothetical protein
MSGSTSQASFSLAGFQVTIIGRFWVTAEDMDLYNVWPAVYRLDLMSVFQTYLEVHPMILDDLGLAVPLLASE